MIIYSMCATQSVWLSHLAFWKHKQDPKYQKTEKLNFLVLVIQQNSGRNDLTFFVDIKEYS